MNKPAYCHAIGCSVPRNPTGLTLIEATLYLSILAVVVVLTLGIYRSVRDQQLTAQMIYEYQAIRNSVQTLYGGIGYGTGSVLNNALVSTNQLPSTLIVLGAGSIRNALGGSVMVVGVNGSQFRISYENVPRRLCPGFLVNATKSGEWLSYAVSPNLTDVPTTGSSIPPPTNAMNTFMIDCNSGSSLDSPVVVTLWSN